MCSPVLRKLRLHGCGLQGPLPELRLPALRELRLNNNQLTGTVPAQALSHLTELHVLNINGGVLSVSFS